MNYPALTSRDNTGIRKMAAAVLEQAIEDLHQGDDDTRAEAWQWLNGENENGLSFELCCSLVGRRPEEVREDVFAVADVDWSELAGVYAEAPELELVAG